MQWFIDRPILYSAVTTRSRFPRVNSDRSNLEAIIRGARSSAARNTKVGDPDMAAKMSNIYIPDLWNGKHVIVA